MYWVQYYFADEYRNLKITQMLSAGQIGYYIANTVVLTGDIASNLDNLAMVATTYQSHVEKLMATILQLMDTNNILRYQIKQLDKKMQFWIDNVNKIKSQRTKTKVT